MKMTNRNVIFFGLAILVGVYLGFQYPIFGLALLIPLIVFIAFILLRNKSGTLASPESSTEAKLFQSAVGKSRIYIMRDGFVGGQQGMNIAINGSLNSQIRSKYFLMAEVDPGKHHINAQMASGSKSKSSYDRLAKLRQQQSLHLRSRMRNPRLKWKRLNRDWSIEIRRACFR